MTAEKMARILMKMPPETEIYLSEDTGMESIREIKGITDYEGIVIILPTDKVFDLKDD